MDSTSVELPGSKIAAIESQDGQVVIRLEPAYLVKTMTGSVERTRWWQNGALVFDDAELSNELPTDVLPAECDGGDVGENVYTYRDMIPVPLESRGRAFCALRIGEFTIRVEAAAVRLDLDGAAKYIERVRPGD